MHTKEHLPPGDDTKFSDDLKYDSLNHFLSSGADSKTDSTGLKTKFDGVNASVNILDKAGKVPRGVAEFHIKYNDVVKNQIGTDVLDSQKKYVKYQKSSNKIRFIDPVIESNYTNQSGISLTRLARPANKVVATNST